MSKTEARSFSRAFKLDVVRRMEAGENIAALLLMSSAMPPTSSRMPSPAISSGNFPDRNAAAVASTNSPATTDAAKPSCQPSLSPPPSSFAYDQ